jgi:hypothetical protein
MEQEIKTKTNENDNDSVGPTEQWKRDRFAMYCITLLCMFTAGVTRSAQGATLLQYLKVGLKSNHVDLYYGAISAVQFLPVVAGTIPLASWMDRTRQLRLFLLVTGVARCISFLLYVIPLADGYIQVISSFAFGVSDLVAPVLYAEILRVYPKEELQVKFLGVAMAYGGGNAFGPLCVLALGKVDTWIGGFHLMYGNSVFCILFIVSVIILILQCCFIQDLSKEFDLKAQSIYSQHKKDAVVDTSWKCLIKEMSSDALMLLLQHAYTCFWFGSIFRFFPFITETLGYGDTALALCYVGVSISVIVLSIFPKILKPTARGVYWIGFTNLIMLCIGQVSHLFNSKQKAFIKILKVLYISCWVVVYFGF